MKWFAKNWWKIVVLTLGAIIAYSFYFSNVILPTRRDAQKRADELQEESDKRAKTATNDSLRGFCLSLAQSTYLDRVKLNATSRDDFDTWTWDSASARDYVEGKLSDDKAECYKKYPIE